MKLFVIAILLIGSCSAWAQKSQNGATNAEPSGDLRSALPTGRPMTHIVYEPYGGVEDRDLILNGHPVPYQDVRSLLDKYLEHSKPELINYSESSDQKVITIEIFWKKIPIVRLATFKITKERPGLGWGYRCIVHECIFD